MGPLRAALSIDFEFFSHLPAYRRADGMTSEDDIGEAAVDPLLQMFDHLDARVTFFIVSDIAERRPTLVQRLAQTDHEIACHTQNHPFLSTLSAQERWAEIKESRKTLRRVTGEPVEGFRAPSFDTADDHFVMLEEAGYRYDSSIIPSRKIPGWYGGTHSQQRPCQAEALNGEQSSSIIEVPVAVMPGLRLPLSGAWLRLMGVRYTRLGMHFLARRGITPVLYLHPWEFVDLPRVEGVPKRVYYRTGKWMQRAVKKLLELPYEFVTVGEVATTVTTE